MEDKLDYIYFPTQSVGGPTGNYILRCPIPSDAAYAEFCIISFTDAGTAAMTATISGVGPQPDPNMTGTSQALTDQGFLYATILRQNTNGSITPTESWERVANPLGVCFITLGAGGVGSPVAGYVSIKFRVKVLNRVPKPAVTVHPTEESQYNHERARNLEIAVLGKEGEIETYGHVPGQPTTPREIETGDTIIKGSQRMFKRK